MARYEHLPIFMKSYDLTLHIENVVMGFSRYNKYTLGTELRERSRKVLELIIISNNTNDRLQYLLNLRVELEVFKVFVRLCHESHAFKNRQAYFFIAECATNIINQNEGWIKKTRSMKRNKNVE